LISAATFFGAIDRRLHHDGHIGAVGGKAIGQGLADAARATGDDRLPAGQVKNFSIVVNAGHFSSVEVCR